jgi:shikimate dehydrogenase
MNGLPDHFREEIPDSSAMVLGAGGAARSVAVGLITAGIGKLVIVNRDVERGNDLLNFLQITFPRCELGCYRYDEVAGLSGEGFRYLVNATSVGWKDGDAPLIDPREVSGLEFYCDVIYRERTTLMERCASLGVEVVGGLEMLIQQAALSLERWFEIEPPLDVMREIARKAQGKATAG